MVTAEEKTTVTATGLTYTEMLATIPWIALLPLGQTRECEMRAHWHRGTSRPCKTPARLVYYDLSGAPRHFCYHHLYAARMSANHIEPTDALWAEVERNEKWLERVTFKRETQ